MNILVLEAGQAQTSCQEREGVREERNVGHPDRDPNGLVNSFVPAAACCC